MNSGFVKIAVVAAAALLMTQGAASAREWYEKSCTASGKDKEGNWYVGGPHNKSHLHIGTNFVSVSSSNNNSKPETSGKANCALFSQAKSDVPGGGYTSAANVTACLQAACTFYGCTCP